MARTADNGLQPLHWVGLVKLGPAELAASPKLHPLRIRAGALGNGTPGPDLMVSPQPRAHKLANRHIQHHCPVMC
uniref:Hint domain-containing protein n=1 Tax=Paracoccus sp. TRP TaxID=412597 RepID=UPI000225F4A6|nr:Hint domain-containing protein [Paracoccus sp. TRP]